MDQRLNLGTEVRELKLGSTFSSNPRTSFHTLKYDFKPASVDLSKAATLDVSSNNQVTVSVPNLDSLGVPKTVFKGNQRNYTKECVLIIDKVTGEITLEKLHHNIQVKKTRAENTNKASLLGQSSSASASSSSLAAAALNANSISGGVAAGGSVCGSSSSGGSSNNSSRPVLENSTQRTVSKTKVSTGVRRNALGGFVQRHSPIQGSPSYPHHRSPQQAPAWNANNAQSTLPSIPMIGMDDDFVSPNAAAMINDSHHSQINTLSASSSSTSNQTLSPALGNSHQQHLGGGSSALNHSNSNNHSNLNNNHNSYQYQQHSSNHHNQMPTVPQIHLQQHNSNDVGLLTSSGESSDSSEESDSGSGSDSDDDVNDKSPIKSSNHSGGHHHHINGSGSLPALLLDEDLRLSESNSSDSDD